MSENYGAEVGIQVVEENPVASRAASDLSKYLEQSRGRERRAPLPHQQDILNDILQGLYDGMQRGYVESPTATGKTYLMGRLAEAFYNSGQRVLILCDRRQQADQILGKVGETGLIQVTDSMDLKDIGVHYDYNRATLEDRVVISTYASLNNFIHTGEIGEFDVILADEAHKGLGLVTRESLLNFCPDALKIGFTATPMYHRYKRLDQILEAPFHSTTLKEAIENDLVAPIHSLVYATDVEIPYLKDTDEFDEIELQALINLKPRNDKAIEFAKDFIRDGRQGVIGCVRGAQKAHARLLARELDGSVVEMEDGSYKLVRAESVGGHLSQDENRKILDAYERGEIDVLTFVDFITEGWNSQAASFLIDLEPTSSIVRKTQKIGRVIRKKVNNLPSIVVDFMDVSRKFQVTALDVIQERYVLQGQKLGEKPKDEDEDAADREPRHIKDRSYIERIINSNLWRELEQISMFKVSDLRLRATSDEPSIKDPIFAKYETLLGKTMSRELGNSMMVPQNAITELGFFIRRYVRTERMTPDAAAVEAYIEEKMPSQRQHASVLARLALQGFDAEPAGIIYRDPRIADEYELEDEVLYNERMATIARAVDSLPAREKTVIEMRYGLNGYGGRVHTLEEIGQALDLTRERVRQLEGNSLARLGSLREVFSVLG